MWCGCRAGWWRRPIVCTIPPLSCMTRAGTSRCCRGAMPGNISTMYWPPSTRASQQRTALRRPATNSPTSRNCASSIRTCTTKPSRSAVSTSAIYPCPLPAKPWQARVLRSCRRKSAWILAFPSPPRCKVHASAQALCSTTKSGGMKFASMNFPSRRSPYRKPNSRRI